MRPFKNYLVEYKDVLELDTELLTEAISSNDKGVLHEILTGKALNHGQHMSPEAKKKHDEIKKNITPEEYKNHEQLAQGTAEGIRKKFGTDIASAHWSSKPGDIGRITGTHETQQENSSDIILRHKNGAHVGISLKVTQKKNGHIPVGNPGAKQTDAQLGLNSTHHYEDAHKKLLADHKELVGKTKGEQKQMIKASPEMQATALKHSNEAIGKIRDEWYSRLSGMKTSELSDHLRNNLLHANPTKIDMYKATTGGSGKDHSVEIEHPATSHDDILKDHKNITVKKAGNNSIEFQHKGKTFLRHRLKPESTPVVTGLKGSAE
jgi:hypothetical protein